ncbi:MAG TPA: SNF2-related protein, partial [Acidobacteriota bacterium]|nr:SNF2-related protein [Acidobacteriota bacterium]
MARLEDLISGAQMRGLIPEGIATVKSVSWYGPDVVEVVFTDAKGQLQQSLVYRSDESSLRVVEPTRRWSFDGDGNRLRLVSEAYRIHLAWLFDPYVAISSSMIEPLPHQISAVYEEMLPRQPLRFLLADDPGAGKTIMAGLLIRELMIRGDLERCLIVAPGSLTEQWQDELYEKFGLEFEILSRDMIAAARTANPFDTKNLLIARLDQLSRDEELQAKFQAAQDWDLVVCDEAHRMSGHISGDEIKYTKRYRLGQTVGSHCRNLLLMTATPHNGKEADFQIFLALLDADRFEGKFRDGVHSADPSDLMRRMVKEDLLKFDGRPLFPERKSYTIKYDLSPLETRLYTEVTDYVREEMNRVERNSDTNGQRRVNVGFALMTLQRRLASSPEAIFRSIQRRRERLESRLREERLLLRGKSADAMLRDLGPQLKESDWDDLYEEAPQEEREAVEQNLVDYATASRTITELELEIARLRELEQIARDVNAAAEDTKWNQLSRILDDPLMVDDHGHRRKLVLFTEFRDTLDYLVRRIRIRFGKPEAVVEIHGGVPRDDRRKVVHAFMNDPQVLVLVANDAAGEGVNLQ